MGSAVNACAEMLESRTLFSTITWAASAGGQWGVASNWIGGVLPKSGDNVVINEPASVQISLAASTSVNSVALTGASLVLQTGTTLTTAGALSNSGSITVDPTAKLNIGGSYTASAGATLSMPGGQAGAISSNVLTNSDFESPAVSSSGTTVPGSWSQFGSTYLSNQYAYTGAQSLQTSGANSGVIENVPATAGDSYSFSVYAMTPAGNPLTGNEQGYIEIIFLSSSGSTLSPADDVTVLSATSATGGPNAGSVGNQGWNFFTTSAVAPASTVSAFAILEVGAYTGSGGGSVYWDAAKFGLSTSGASSVTAASIANSGTLSIGPGNTVSTAGTFTQTSSGTLDIQLGGSPYSGEYGSLTASGTASFAGTLQSDIVDGYIPSSTDQFTVLQYPSETGNFSTYTLASASGITFAGSVTFTNVMLAAAPSSGLATTVNATSNLLAANTNLLGISLTYGDTDATTSQTASLVEQAGLTLYRFPNDSGTADYHFNQPAQYGDPYAQNIPEFVQFIQSVGGTGMITVDYGSGSPQEAAAEVAYLMGSPSDTTSLGTGLEWNDSTGAWQSVNWGTVGYWASLRAASPLATDDGLNFMRIDHPAPFTNIKYWEIGDEEYGGWETDHHGTAGPGGVSTGASHDPATYVNFTEAFATAAAEITTYAGLPAISIGVDSNDPTGTSYNDWTSDVLTLGKAAGFVPGFISDHWYPAGPGTESDNYLLNQTSSDPQSQFDFSVRYSEYESLLSQSYSPSQVASIAIMNTEFNSVYGDPGKQSTSLVEGLFVANSIGSMLDSGYAASILFALRTNYDTTQNDSNALYGWREGGDYGILGDPNDNQPPASGPYVAFPGYYAEELASKIIQAGGEVETASSNYTDLDTYAVLESDGHLDLLVINTNPAASLTDQFNLSGFAASGAAQVYQYGEAQDIAQSQSSTGASSLASVSTTVSLTNGSFSYTFPAYSMTVIDLSPKSAAPPVVSLTTPASGSDTNNNKPTFSGVASTASGDSATVGINVYAGSSASGAPVQTLTAAWNASTGAWSAPASAALPDGTYTAQASQSDAAGNIGLSAADTFTVDTTPPIVTLTAPASGSSTTNTTPTFSGAAGTASGDLPAITVSIYNGTSISGTAVETLTATSSGGSYSVAASPALPAGTYTARASQSDTAANTGVSPIDTFTISLPVTKVGQLTGTASASTTGSYDGKTSDNYTAVFDGNTNTYWDSPNASGNWVQINLGAADTITSIAYAPRATFEYRMVGGVFEASNDPTFSTGVVTLYTVTSTPGDGLTTVAVTPGGTYQYIRYVAAAGSYGNIAEMQVFGTTGAAATAPAAPGAPTLTSSTSTTATIAWTASATAGVTGYIVLRNGSQIGTTSSTTFTYSDSGLSASTTYSYTVEAVASGVDSVPSWALSVTTPAAPVSSTPVQLTGTASASTTGSYANDGDTYTNVFDGNTNTFWDSPSASGNYVQLNLGAQDTITSIAYAPRATFEYRMVGGVFEASNDPTFSTGVVTLYTVSSTPGDGLTTVAVSPGGTYQYIRYIAPAGSYGNIAEMQVFGTTGAAASAPVAPGAPTLTSSTSTTATIAWTASATAGITGYIVLRNGSQIATTSSSVFTYSDSGLSASTTYSYTVEAVASGLDSVPSGALSITTPAAPVSTTPVQLTGTASASTTGSYDGKTSDNYTAVFDGNTSTFWDSPSASGNYVQLNLGAADTITSIAYAPRATFEYRMVGGVFEASNDPTFSTGVVTLYTVSSTPADGLNTVAVTPGGTYQYIRYVAPAGSYGNIAEMQVFGTTGAAATAPAAPGAPTLTSSTSTTATIAWTASPTAGVSGYIVLRNGSQIGTTSSSVFTYSDSGLSPSTTYSYTVEAVASGVDSMPSGPLSVTTPAAPVSTTPVQLTGTASASTTGSYDGKTSDNYTAVFDGNTNTYWDSPNASGNYVQLNLGAADTITSIAYAPRPGFEYRMVGGVFEASNDPTFSTGVVTLYTVSSTPADGLNTVAVTPGGTYQYIRYVAPAGSYGNIAEMQVFGY